MAAPNLATAYITILPSMKGAREKIAADLGDAGEKGGVAGGKNAEKGFVGGLKGISSKAAGIAAAASAVVGAGVVAGMTKAVMAASELEQSTGAIDAVYKENAQAMHDMASSAATNLGLTRDEFNQLGTVIGAQLKNGGTAMDELAPKAGELIGVGADLAAMFGGTTADAVGALSSALKGERDPIERYGVSLNQAAIDAKAAELGFEKVGNSLSAEANQAATLALIMEQTADAHGAFGREANTMAGQVERAKASFGNLVAELGTAFLPVVTEAVSLLNAHVIPVISGVVNGFGRWAAANPQLASGLAIAVAGITALSAAILGILIVAGPIAAGISAIGAAFAGVSLAAAAPVAAVVALVAALGVAAATSQGFRDAVGAVFQKIGEALSPVVAMIQATVLPVLQQMGAAFMGMVGQIGAALAPLMTVIMQIAGAVVTLLTPAITFLTGVFGPAFTFIGTVIATAFQFIGTVISTAINIITGILQVALALITGDWSAAWTGMGALLGTVWSGIASIVSGAAGLLWSIISGAVSMVASIWSNSWAFMSELTGVKVGEVLDYIGSIPDRVMGFFAGAGSWLVDSGRNIVQGLLDGAGQLLPQIGQFFLDKLPGWIRGPFEAALGIHSPSRVFAGYGENIGEGLALGVESMGSRVRSSTSGLADSALSGAQALADGVGNVSTFQSASVAASNAPLYVPADWTERYGGQQQAAYANATEAVLDALSQMSVTLDGRRAIGALTDHRAWPTANRRETR